MMEPRPARTAVMHSGVCSSRILRLWIAAAYTSLFSHLQGQRFGTREESEYERLSPPQTAPYRRVLRGDPALNNQERALSYLHSGASQSNATSLSFLPCPFLTSLRTGCLLESSSALPFVQNNRQRQRFRVPASKHQAFPHHSSLQRVTKANLESLVPGK